MPKRALQPTRRRHSEQKESCPNRAVLNPGTLPQPMTYRPLGQKRNQKKKKTESIEEVPHEASQTIPTQSKE